MMKRHVFGWIMFLFMLVTLLACSADYTYEFYFETNGGTYIGDLIIERENWDGTFPVPLREGYAFNGWYTDPELTHLFDSQEFIDSDERSTWVYAKWVPQTLTVSVEHYVENTDGTYSYVETTTVAAAYGETCYAEANVYENFRQNVDHPDRIFSGTPSTGIPLVLRVYYERIAFLATFYTYGAAYVQLYVKFGTIIIPPADPLQEGYIFDGWYDDSFYTIPLSSGVMPDHNENYVAKWIPLPTTITVEHYREDVTGTYVLYETETLDGLFFTLFHAEPKIYPDHVEKTDHPQSIDTATPEPGEPSVLKLYYERKSYTLAFEENGGATLTDLLVKFGDSITPPADPIRTGYEFGGWFADASLVTSYDFGVMPTENVTVYLLWIPIDYELGLEENGGEDLSNLLYRYGDSIELPTPRRIGYTFGGWYRDAECTALPFANGTTMPDVDMTLYAKWTIRIYTMYFMENGGSEVPDLTQEYATTVVIPMDLTKEHYEFGGWYVDAEFTIPNSYDTMPPYNFTLFAKWIPVMVTVTYVTNGATAISPYTAQSGSSFEVTTPDYVDHSFAGWYEDEALTIAYINDGSMPETDLTLYAKWYGLIYMVHFDTMGGAYIQDLSQPAGSPLTLPTPIFNGFIFVGWYDAMLTTPFTGTVMPDENLVLYAKWAPV